MPEENKTSDKHEIDIEVNVTKDIDQSNEKKVDIDAEKEKWKKEESKRTNEILAISEKHGMPELARKFIEEGKDPNEFGLAVLEAKGKIEKVDEKKGDLGLSDQEIKQFSFIKAIRAMASALNGEGNSWSKHAPYEKEISDAYSKKMGKEARGVFIPREILYHKDLNVGTATAGGNLVATELLASSFIELLRNRMVTRQLGATILGGLQGNIAIPRQSGGATAYWITEGTSPTESQQTFDQVTMTPKTIGAFTDITRKLILQSSIDVENLVRMDLAKVIAIELDRVAVNGSGSGAEPTGILKTSGIGNVGTSPAAPTYSDVIALWTALSVDNADFGSLSYLTTPGVCAKLMQTFTNTGTSAEIPVWKGGPGDGSMIGFNAVVSNQVPSDLGSSSGATSGISTFHALLFGNWSDLLIGEWSGMDLLIDPYTHSTSGTVRTVILMDADIAVRHPESFAAMKEVDATP
jgi:HK97 family phage major capsid protein